MSLSTCPHVLEYLSSSFWTNSTSLGLDFYFKVLGLGSQVLMLSLEIVLGQNAEDFNKFYFLLLTV